VFKESSLRRTLKLYFDYYHGLRTHLSLEKDAPETRPVQAPELGLVKGGFLHRAGYAVSRIFVTQTDSGHKRFNYSEFAGNAVTAGISNHYSPLQEGTVSNTLTTWGTQIMWDTVAREARNSGPTSVVGFTKGN
jgi:hypothetical protein